MFCKNIKKQDLTPFVLPYEIGNALSAMLKRQQITQNEVLPILDSTKNIPVRLVTVDIKQALKIAIEFNIYAYDAYFLQCAKSTSNPLYTMDKRMRTVARELRIPLVGELL